MPMPVIADRFNPDPLMLPASKGPARIFVTSTPMHDTQMPDLNFKLSSEPTQAIEQLSAMIAAYNEVTDRLNRSHARLQDEVRGLREELKRKNEMLEQKSRLAALGEMAAGMAHEIRNPLGAVQLYASMLEKELAGQGQRQDWARKIVRTVSSLDTIVSDMMAYTQNQVCSPTEVSFWGILHEMLDLLRPQFQASEIEIDLRKVDRKLTVHVDIGMMNRILMNLLLNAFDAINGPGRIQIAASRRPDRDNHVCIRISDSGPGIPADVIRKIFDPFFTTRDSGTGLGLAIVHRLVDCHNGMITAANAADGGAEFTILLP